QGGAVPRAGRAQCGGNPEKGRASSARSRSTTGHPATAGATPETRFTRGSGMGPDPCREGPVVGRGWRRTHRPGAAVLAPLLRRYRALPPVLAEGDVDEVAGGDLDAVVDAVAAGPGLDGDGDRGGADALDGGVDAEHVANLHRGDEGHGLDGDGDG